MAYTGFGYPGMPTNISSGTSDITGVPWVSSIEEVRSAQIPFGYERQVFFDRTDNIFYMKWSSGQVRAFQFKEVQIPSNNPMNFVSRQEFDELRSKYEQLIQSIPTANVAQPAEQPAEPNAGVASNEAVPGDAGAGQTTVFSTGGTNGNGPVAN